MIRPQFVLIAWLSVVAWQAGAAEALTAVCEKPRGFGLHYFDNPDLPRDKNQKLEKYEDAMGDAVYTIVWSMRAKTATVSVARTANNAGSPILGEAKILDATDDRVSMVAINANDTFIFTLFPQTGRLLESRHSSAVGRVDRGTIGKLFISECRISVR